MITGCNTNVSHRGKQFHVQTEDSGRAHPHVISHVYHGGTIIASEKRDYGDRIDAADLDRQVRSLIEEQHQAMLRRLRDGELDAVIDERLTGVRPAGRPAGEPAAGAPEATAPRAATTDGGSTDSGRTEPSFVEERPVVTARESNPQTRAAFGDGVDPQKPLDEVILEYLVDKARDRSSVPRATRASRSKG